MADKKMTPQNKIQVLIDMFNNTGNSRVDIYYYRLTDVQALELRQQAFEKGLLIKITPVDDYVGTISFDRILT